jgi:cellulose synthase operon protein C
VGFRALSWAAGSIVVGSVLFSSIAAGFVWPNVPEQVARGLASGEVSQRRLAAQRVVDLPPEIGLKLAAQAMTDPDVEVRLRVSRAAIAFRLPRGGDVVMPWLSEGDARLRLAACDVIRASPTDRSVVALGRVLGDPNPHVRLAAASAMGASGMTEAVSPLLGHLDDNSPEVRAEVARALGRIGDARAVVPLIGKVQDSVSDVRKTVARALGELGDLRATSALMLALQDASGEVRLEAVTALGRLRSDEATLAIGALVGRQDGPGAAPPGARLTGLASAADVRAAALRALGRIASESAIRVLVGALGRDDPSAPRSAVREALVTAGKPAVKALTASLSGSPSPQAAGGAALVLGALKAREGIEPIVRAMQRGVVPLRYGLRALAAIGAQAALPTVLEMMDDADPQVRKEAIIAAAKLLEAGAAQAPAGRGFVDGRPVDPASVALKDPQTPVDEKIELVKLLGRTGAPRAQAVLLPLAAAKPTGLRLAVLEALGTLQAGSPEVDAALLKAIDDESSDVRLRAATALSRVGTKAVAKELLHRLEVAAEQDRGAIGIALSGALARATDGALAALAAKAIETAPESARDALIEGLGRMRGAEAAEALTALAKGSIDDRRKVAEAIAGHPELAGVLRVLAQDPDPGVRANAVWSLGAVGVRGDLALVARHLKDRDAAVSGNAAAAIGRIASRSPDPTAAPALCAALSEQRPYIRANAIAALSTLGAGCGSSGPRSDPSARSVRDFLSRDPAESVRLAAADHLQRAVARAGPKGDAAASRALLRCSAEDRNATVASRCANALPAPVGSFDVSIYVVPENRNAPEARAAFTLVRADGLLRLGVADRRGEFFEFAAPGGVVRLGVPAALVR